METNLPTLDNIEAEVKKKIKRKSIIFSQANVQSQIINNY